jgi:protocatechuate 3,4-dioxygenase beta subunit
VRNLKPEDLKTLLVPYTPLAGSRIGELTATFDIVLGRTAAEDDAGQLRGVAQPLSRRG